MVLLKHGTAAKDGEKRKLNLSQQFYGFKLCEKIGRA